MRSERHDEARPRHDHTFPRQIQVTVSAGPLAYIGSYEDKSTLGALIQDRAESTPGDPFVMHVGQIVTFSQQFERAMHAAAALASLGVGSGDKVALMLPNCLEFLDLWFGCALLGAVFVPVNTALKADGLRYIIEHSDARAVVIDESVVENYVAALGPDGPELRFVRGSAPEWGRLDELLAGSCAEVSPAVSDPDDLASVLYTSGTTGLPKGVMNCHGAYITAGYEFARQHVRLRSDDVLYTSLPLFHVNAQMLTTVGSLLSGRPMVLAPRFSASRFFDDIREHSATIFNYIGAMLTMLYKQPERDGDAANPIRLAIGGAAPKELWPQFEQRFGLTILEIYGLTETATYCMGNPPDDIRVGTIGRPVSWADVRIHRSDGSEADVGEPGEIVIRAKKPKILFKGYYKREDATAESMTGGWFHSGDRGVRRDDGYLIFVDRLKDSIRRRGENISSYEVERVMNSHPAVVESAAIGVPSELGEEDVMIVVVPRDAQRPDPVELIAFCAERMASFMVPRYVKFRSALPKTATQRVQKYQLREEGVASAWDSTPVESPVAST